MSYVFILLCFCSMIASLDQNDSKFQILVSKFSRCLIRSPEHLASSSIHDRHPQRVIKDLLFFPKELIPALPTEDEFSEWLASTAQPPSEPDQEEVISTPEKNIPDKLPETTLTGEKAPLLSSSPPQEAEEDYLDMDLVDLDGSTGEDPGALIDLKDDFFD